MGEHKAHNMQETSLKAYDELKIKLGERQAEVYEALRQIIENNNKKDATDQEIRAFIELFKEKSVDTNYVRPRRYELVNKFKLIGFSQKRECNVTGKMALAWKINRRRNEDGA